MRFTMSRIRTIDAPADEGGSDSDAATADESAADTTDWKAKFETERAHSREWEKRAKANSSAASELEKLRDAGRSDLEKATARAEKAEKALADYRHAADVSGWKAAAAKASGVPVELLHGDTEEDITASANALKAFADSLTAPKAASVSNAAATPKGGDNPNLAVVKALFGR